MFLWLKRRRVRAEAAVGRNAGVMMFSDAIGMFSDVGEVSEGF